MHHPPHFPPLPRLSPHHKKRADVEQRFNTPKGFISSNTPSAPFFFRQYPNFPLLSPNSPSLSPHHKKRADVKQRFNAPKGFISSNTPPVTFFFRQYPHFPPFSHLHISAPYFPFPFSSYHAHPLFFRQSPPFPSSFSQLSLTFPLFCSFFFSIHSVPTREIKKIHISAKKT